MPCETHHVAGPPSLAPLRLLGLGSEWDQCKEPGWPRSLLCAKTFFQCGPGSWPVPDLAQHLGQILGHGDAGSAAEGFAPGWSCPCLAAPAVLEAEEQIEGGAGWPLFSSAFSETTHLSPAINFFQLKPLSMPHYQGLSCDARAVSMGLSLTPLTAGFLSRMERSHAADGVKHGPRAPLALLQLQGIQRLTSPPPPPVR